MSKLSFRTKLVLSFALTGIVPLTGILVVTSSMVRSAFQRDAADRVSQAGQLLESQLDRDGHELAQKLAEMAADFEFRELLYRYAVGADRRRAQGDLISWLERARRERGLPLVQLTALEGSIVASGHEGRRFDQPDPGTVALMQRFPGTAALAPEDGLAVRGLALKVSRAVGEGDVGLILTGGVLVNEDYLRRLPVMGHDALIVASRDGSVLVSATADGELARRALEQAVDTPLDARLRAGGFLVEPVVLKEIGSTDPVQIYLATSRRPLEALLRKFNLTFALLVIAGTLLAWLAAVLLARPVSAQIDRLVEALELVAAGNLAARVEVRRDDELGQVARAFNTMTKELADSKQRLIAAERVAAWQEIARRIAHEIKNPLSPIQLSIETLRKSYRAGRDDFSEILEESTATVVEEVQRLRRIVEEFSSFARLPKPRMVEEDIHDVLRSVMALHAGLDERYRLHADLDEQAGRVRFDPDQMHQVFVNLIKNAIEALPQGGDINVRTRRQGARFVISVEDSGAGLEAEVRDRLFQPYATTKTGGTGLGLAIAHRIVSEHGGTIAPVESRSGSGAVFEVSLPLG